MGERVASEALVRHGSWPQAGQSAAVGVDRLLIAFIDDDEFPVDRWLVNHFNYLKGSIVHGSLGPVLPYFEKNPPKWVLNGKFFHRPSYRTGTVLHWNDTRSGNVLLRRTILDSVEPAFDPKFGSGGEDKDFFRRHASKGYLFAWCAEAPVYELVPEARCKRTYLIKKALLRGKAKARAVPQDLMSIVKSLVGILFYAMALPVTFFLSHHIFLHTLIRGCDRFWQDHHVMWNRNRQRAGYLGALAAR